MLLLPAANAANAASSLVEQNRQKDRAVTGRAVCERCWRPKTGCYCAAIHPIDTRTRLVLLQHPREREVAIGTARMASLCLTNSELHVGIDWSRSTALARALADPDRPPVLLYPGPGAIDIMRAPPSGPVTLIVVDGTWSQTKKVVRVNPNLAALPRYAFVPPSPSDYRIRKEPDVACVATIEALLHALSALEGDPSRFAALLAPFKRMIDFQLECEERFRGAPSRHAQFKRRKRRLGVPRLLSERTTDLVCVAAEANAWPYPPRSASAPRRDGASRRPDELIHWAALRPATGESFSVIVAPEGDLAPGTVLHTGIDEASLRAGVSLTELHARWAAFVRPTDVVASWGHYETNLFLRAGGTLTAARLDLRHVARDVHRASVGSLSDYQGRLRVGAQTGDAADDTPALGRAGRKLRAIAEIVESFALLSGDAGDLDDGEDAAGADGGNARG